MDETKNSERIKQSRKRKNLTQAELAEILGISEMTVRRWENGKSSPRVEELVELAQALDTTIEYLMGSNEKNPDISFTQTRTDQPDRIIYNYGNHHFDLPATPEGYKAFNEALSAMIQMNQSSLALAN